MKKKKLEKKWWISGMRLLYKTKAIIWFAPVWSRPCLPWLPAISPEMAGTEAALRVQGECHWKSPWDSFHFFQLSPTSGRTKGDWTGGIDTQVNKSSERDLETSRSAHTHFTLKPAPSVSVCVCVLCCCITIIACKAEQMESLYQIEPSVRGWWIADRSTSLRHSTTPRRISAKQGLMKGIRLARALINTGHRGQKDISGIRTVKRQPYVRATVERTIYSTTHSFSIKT